MEKKDLDQLDTQIYQNIVEKQKEIDKCKKELEDYVSSMIVEFANDCDITLDARWANLNKRNTLSEYLEECDSDNCYDRKARCTKVLEFPQYSEVYKWLCKNLMTDIPMFDNMGGSSSEETEEDIKKLKEKYDFEWPYHCHWYNDNCILVRENGEDKFVIDPQGYSYARYVGLPVVIDYLKIHKEIKQKDPNAMALLRCGDFYVTYNEDAISATQILGITRCMKKGVYSAGFPHHMLDQFLPKLTSAGKRVVICDEPEILIQENGTDN